MAVTAARGELAHIDEHTVAVAAAPLVVWDALLEVAEHSFTSRSSTVVARALGCRDTSAGGARPLAARSAFPGFHVLTADAPLELKLAGSHRFASYALIFRLEEPPNGGTQLRAETQALFPGLRGRCYRALVIGTRGHVLVVRRLLTAVKRRAERA